MSSFHDIKAARVAFEEEELELLGRRTSALRADLSNARLALARAQHVVDSVAQDLEAVESRTAESRRRMEDLRTQLSPDVMATIPDELLRMIFFALSSIMADDLRCDNGDGVGYYDQERAALPFRVSAVCRRWRAVAMDAPSLWGSYLALHSDLESDKQCRAAEEYLHCVLSRSLSAPLDIAVMWDDIDDETWSALSPTLRRIWGAIGLHAKRWRIVDIYLPEPAVSPECLEIFRRTTPLLEHLAVVMNGTATGNPWRDDIPTFLPHCPKLRSLRTDLCHVVWCPPHQPVPVTFLMLSSVDMPSRALWGVLVSCPALATLKIGVVSTDFTWRPSGKLYLSELRDLELIDNSDKAFASWAHSIEFPSLTSLKLSGINLEPLSLLLPRVASTLSVLRVSHTQRLGPDELNCLSILRNLTSVHISYSCVNVGIPPDFFLRWSAENIWPRLEEVEFSAWSKLTVEGAEAFLKLVRDRLTPGTTEVKPLRRVNFRDSPRVPSWLEDQVSLLIPHHVT
ncbi:hypothetical protein EXIGLDRAFT_836324 [Exidia glandulosa HHB12029]|uniref:Uncharacterized protein n=1 Tax=Exidia glandulosa HHB12029 TaxID=1314781 RepID=A0A165HY69_EXIGL|nr:hypothetical protein EXIGLDRAFT_836324 [Exidia glandulosa HHB12029]